MLTLLDVKTDVQRRVERVTERMTQDGIATLLLYNSGQHNMLRMDQVFYLTDYRPLGPTVLLVARDGTRVLVTSPRWDIERAQGNAHECRVVGVDADGLAASVARLARELPQPLGLAGRGVMPLGFADELFAELGSDLIDGETLVPSVGTTRTPVELERIERAALIADVGFQRLREVAQVGMREYELAAEVEAAMQSEGSEDNFGLIGAGAHNVAIRAPTDRRLERGDVIVGEITPCYRGYLAQLCRTFVLGKPTDLQRQKFDLLIAAEQRGFEAAMPGRPSSDIARAINEVIANAGYAEYCRQPYMRTRGHGLGLGGVVPYDVTEDTSPVIQEQMSFVIHPNQYIPETGYLMVGDTVVIESDGPRRLTQTPIELFWREA
jgi:Xaa-Pro aminopeptidase